MQNYSISSLSSSLRRNVVDWVSARSTSEEGKQSPPDFFHSPVGHALKQEILYSGRKLWERQYVDGNGGNITARVSRDHVLCTPTLCSKGDLREEDLCLVDLENCQVCGNRPQTSEIRLHLEIYKAVPEARAVIHCHPPYATAHAIAGIAPKGNFLPEQEVFVGPVAVAPYETPGTQAFAETVIPLARDHNTILLRNHGIVCWADTVTHAEWYVEVVETYCKTMMIASQLGGTSLKEIPPAKLAELLAIKKKMGLPDPRIGKDPNEREALPPYPAELSASQPSPGIQREIDRLVAEFTEKISSLVDRSA